MSAQSSNPVMHDACEDLGQNYLKADIIQSLALLDLDRVEFVARTLLLRRELGGEKDEVPRQPHRGAAAAICARHSRRAARARRTTAQAISEPVSSVLLPLSALRLCFF